MPDQWYYSVANEQKGPVSPEELLALERAGVVGAASLVWKEGLAGWEPWASVAPGLRGEVPASGEDLATCACCGQRMPRSQMVSYGDQLVAIDHKEAFVQALREGRSVAALPGSGQMQYVGFWWRVLASVIDWAVKLVPNILCMVPYYAVMFSQGIGMAETPQFSPALIIAYALGVLATLFVSIFYDTWMVGKYGGTVGKLALAFRIVNADGSKVSYGRAFGRWAAEVLEKFIAVIIAYGLIAVGIAIGFVVMTGEGDKASVALGAIFGALVLGMVGAVAGCFPWFMAGWTRQKTALHDILCGTRVIRRPDR